MLPQINGLFLILLFSFLSAQLYCQTWKRTFSSSTSVLPYDLTESYDRGIILGTGIAIGTLVKIGWIIKLDVNGDILWEKKLGDGSNLFHLHGIDKTPDGGLIITGVTDTINFDQWDPFVVKLNSCGEAEWCRIFQTNMKTDFGMRIRTLPDNSYGMLVYDWKEDMSVGTFLYHISAEGELLWEQEYFATDTLVNSEYPVSLELTENLEFIMTGHCYVPDSGQVTPWWPRPMVILADSSGEAIWELPWGFSSQFVGEGFQTVCSDNKFYTAISRYPYPPQTGYRPCLIKTSMEGISEGFHVIKPDAQWGKATTLDRISDSILIIGMWYAFADTGGVKTIARIDTNGLIIKEKLISQSDYIIVDALVTSDQKYLALSVEDVNNKYVTELWKLNMDLEFDTIYNQPITYDSLCSHPITSGTLLFPCDLIVSVRETGAGTDKVRMVVYPNPAREIVHVKIPECISVETNTGHMVVITTYHQWYKELTLQVTDITGKIVFNRTVPPDEKEVTIQVGQWRQGLYCFTLRYMGKTVSTSKILVQ